jgi:hypothetical protein
MSGLLEGLSPQEIEDHIKSIETVLMSDRIAEARIFSDRLFSDLSSASGVLSDRATLALMALNTKTRHVGMTKVTPRQMALSTAMSLLDAVPIVWTHKITDVALEQRIPRCTVSMIPLPVDYNLFMFDKPRQVERLDVGSTGITWHTLVYSHGNRGIVVCDFIFADGEWECFHHRLAADLEIPGDEDTDAIHTSGMLMKLCSFLNTPLAASSFRKAKRAMRRRDKDEPKLYQSDVRFVDLRVPIYDEQDRPKPEDGPERDFRWIVRGHYRAQWYPSEEAHQLIWIEPFLKGPDGAPIRPRAYRVVR